jgi:hypothetical protein
VGWQQLIGNKVLLEELMRRFKLAGFEIETELRIAYGRRSRQHPTGLNSKVEQENRCTGCGTVLVQRSVVASGLSKIRDLARIYQVTTAHGTIADLLRTALKIRHTSEWVGFGGHCHHLVVVLCRLT